MDRRQKHDGLEQRVDEGFANVDKRFEQVDKRFEQVDQRFEQIELRLGRVEERVARVESDLREVRVEVKMISKGLEKLGDEFHAFNRTLLQVGAGFVGTVILAAAGLIATQL